MKKLSLVLLMSAGFCCLQSSCVEDPELSTPEGNLVITPKTEFTSASFGDSLAFTIGVEDQQPLSTLAVQLLFGEDKVSEVGIRTTSNGDYSGKIFVPFLKDIPDGTATLRLVLTNTAAASATQDISLPLSRPSFPHLTLVANGSEYQMEPTATAHSYSVTDASFPSKMKGYIKAHKVGEQGNELVFGLESGGIVQGSTGEISFTNTAAGYTVSFSTLSYEYAPMLTVSLNGQQMVGLTEEQASGNRYIKEDELLIADLTLAKDQTLTFEGIADFDDWWIDPDFLEKTGDNTLRFLPEGGSYRIGANFTYRHFTAEVLSNGDLASLQADGTGAIWIIGDGIGKPSTSKNYTGWTTEKGLCLTPIGDKKYRITGTVGLTLTTTLNFKFFYQKGWGGEFAGRANEDKGVLTTTSTLVVIGNKLSDEDPGNAIDNGNIQTPEGQPLELFGIYTFTVDVSAGLQAAKLSVEKVGEYTPPPFEATIDGVALASVDADNYKVEKDFTQGQPIVVAGIDDLESWWIDPDYFDPATLAFAPISGKYRIIANTAYKFFKVEAMDGDNLATLQADGTGAIWAIGDGIGKPSLDNEVKWATEKGLCMVPLGNKKYQLTFVAGTTLRSTSINFKFFFQQSWGGEFVGIADGDKGVLTTTSDAIMVKDDGNLTLKKDAEEADIPLVDGATYVFTIDVSAGLQAAVLTVTKK
jgi:hypothetical protein